MYVFLDSYKWTHQSGLLLRAPSSQDSTFLSGFYFLPHFPLGSIDSSFLIYPIALSNLVVTDFIPKPLGPELRTRLDFSPLFRIAQDHVPQLIGLPPEQRKTLISGDVLPQSFQIAGSSSLSLSVCQEKWTKAANPQSTICISIL